MVTTTGSLGCHALVTSLNGGSFFSPEHYATRAAYDYSDIHFYVDHPAFLGKSWSLPARVGNANFLVRGPENRGVALPLEHRLLEKPFAVTEFDIGDARDGGDVSILQLDQTGRRLGQVPVAREGGTIRFDAETVAPDGSVSFFHEIAR